MSAPALMSGLIFIFSLVDIPGTLAKSYSTEKTIIRTGITERKT